MPPRGGICETWPREARDKPQTTHSIPHHAKENQEKSDQKEQEKIRWQIVILSAKHFARDYIHFLHVCTYVIQISENTDKLTDDFKLYYNAIPWRAVKGMRNRIVHDYGNVDLSVVYDTVINDIPQLLKEFQKIL